MSNVTNISDRDSRDVEAGLWISKIGRGLDEHEHIQFNEWVSVDENRREFIYLAKLWDDMDELSRLAEIFPKEGFAERKRGGRYLAYAASIMIAVTLSVLGLSKYQEINYQESYATSVGEQLNKSLPDGSELIINTDTIAEITFSQKRRLLTLVKGEIYIDVAHDNDRPLYVHAGDTIFQAVGTAFNVEFLGGERVELIVEQGKVKVSNMFEPQSSPDGVFTSDVKKEHPTDNNSEADWGILVTKGEKVIFDGVQRVTPPKSDYLIEDNLAWRDGHLQFRGEELSEVVKEVGRYTSTHFTFDTDEIKKIRIAGRFRAGDVTGLLLALEDTFEVSSKRVGDKSIDLYYKR